MVPRFDLTDAAWLAHRYDPGHDAVHLVRAVREERRRIPFLTENYLAAAGSPHIVTRETLLSARPTMPAHFIFHSAFCCSTLLAAALDVPGVATAFKEPQILNDIVGWRHRGADRRQIGDGLRDALRLMTPFERAEAAVIKPSNVVNGLAVAAMLVRPEAHAVLMYAPLRVFLASIARKGMWGRLWVRDLLAKQLTDGIVDLGFEPRDYMLHTDLQAAAVGWLAQAKLFADMAARFSDRVRTLDSEVLVARPTEALTAAAALFRLTLPDPRRIVATVFERDAKDGSAFVPGQRERERTIGESLHADEIDKVHTWAEAVAANAGVALTPPAPLL